MKVDDAHSQMSSMAKNLDEMSQQFKEDFRTANASLQMEAIKIGLHQACVEMKDKYPQELKEKNPLYSYPDAGELVMQRFYDLVSYDCSLFRILEVEGIDVGSFKKHFREINSGCDGTCFHPFACLCQDIT
ncbi:unnamed protein product [Lactuca virosa]|uniref:Uncharacterized protein n=1 Tax=Lactuca virosa TaxID=75947 RepID=A0AAU9N1F5_9ASTR|nr:unnamed protein product [Lactuca virosa]